MKVCLDYGHGGKDSGSVSNDKKVYEKDLIVQIGRKLENQLKKNNIQYILTRKNDEYVELIDRCNIANDNNVDLFVSIHINSTDRNKEKVSGAEVCHYDGQENAALATKVCNAICDVTGANNRGNKPRNNLVVLNSTKAKAILIECGFISNSMELAKLQDSNYQDKIVAGICNGLDIKYYRDETEEKEVLWRVVTNTYQDIELARKEVQELNARGINAFIVKYEK